MKLTQEQLQSDYIAARNLVHFEAKLDSKAGDRRDKILLQVLVEEFGRFQKPQSESHYVR